jgi:2-C-methyl-D-erythritol 4-phosphate cytidylyltransferase
MKAAAIVAAAGAGLRMGNEIRKQYLEIAGVPVLVRSLQLFASCPLVDEIAAVIPAGDQKAVALLIEPYFRPGEIILVEGGSTRQESVARGLAALTGSADYICIHDAARPMAGAALLLDLLNNVPGCGAVVPVIRPADTVKEVDNRGYITGTPCRDKLRLVQTPQVFRRELIEKAYKEAEKRGTIATDDAALVEMIGVPVMTVPGEEGNFKITTPQQLELAEWFLKEETGR